MIHWQVAAGNRSGRGTARHFRIELRDVGLEEPVTVAADLGASSKDVDDLLERKRTGSRSDDARVTILDILDAEGTQESDTLDARVAAETGLSVKTIKNIRVKLADDGLIRARPDKDELGTIVRWNVSRTQAPRP